MSRAVAPSNPQAHRPSAAALRRIHNLRGQKGRIAAIEPRSGDYFLAENLLDAVSLGRQQYPRAIFYIVRVGFPAAHVHHGGPLRARQ